MKALARILPVLLTGLVAAGVAGCFGREEPPFTVPELDLSVDHFSGTPLSGPRGEPVPQAPSAYERVRVALHAIEKVPEDFLSPLSSVATVTSVSGDAVAPRASR